MNTNLEIINDLSNNSYFESEKYYKYDSIFKDQIKTLILSSYVMKKNNILKILKLIIYEFIKYMDGNKVDI